MPDLTNAPLLLLISDFLNDLAIALIVVCSFIGFIFLRSATFTVTLIKQNPLLLELGGRNPASAII